MRLADGAFINNATRLERQEDIDKSIEEKNEEVSEQAAAAQVAENFEPSSEEENESIAKNSEEDSF
jgi:hypothetical protein